MEESLHASFFLFNGESKKSRNKKKERETTTTTKIKVEKHIKIGQLCFLNYLTASSFTAVKGMIGLAAALATLPGAHPMSVNEPKNHEDQEQKQIPSSSAASHRAGCCQL